jgi:hypothetical protein
MRWHPDKLMAAIGMRLLPEEYDEVGAEIAGVFRGIQEEHKNRLRIRGTLPPGNKVTRRRCTKTRAAPLLVLESRSRRPQPVELSAI